MSRLTKIAERLSRFNQPRMLLWMFASVAFAIRLMPWKASIIQWGKRVIFIQPDAYYQMRRSAIWAQNFPSLPTMDWYMAYPYGAECPWPPLYNLTIALVTLVLGGGRYDEQVLQLVTALLPPIVAALCVFPLYRIARIIWDGQLVPLAASFFVIFMPGMLGYSAVTSGDHHIAETFAALWFYYYSLATLKATYRGTPWMRDAVKQGLMISAGVLIWQGQVVFYTVNAAFLMALFIWQRRNIAFLKRAGSAVLLAGMIGSAVTAAVRFAIPRATEQTLFDFGFFSYFQPIYIAFLFLSVFMCSVLLRKTARRPLYSVAVGIVAIGAALVAVVPPLRAGLDAGIHFLMKSDPWHASINEFQNTFRWEQIRLPTTIGELGELLYMASFFFPLTYALDAFRRVLMTRSIMLGHGATISIPKRPVPVLRGVTTHVVTAYVRKMHVEQGMYQLFYGVTAVAVCALAVYQRRWGNAYGPMLAIGLALFTRTVYAKLKAGHGVFREFIAWRRERKHIGPGLLSGLVARWEKSPVAFGGAVIVVLLVPYYYLAMPVIQADGWPISSDLYNSLVWIRNYTPPTSHLWNPVKKPEYSILAPWDHGHYIQYISERPTTVNNFGHQLRGDGFKTAIYVWSCETEQELLDLMKKYGVRFLFLNDPSMLFNPAMSPYLKEGFYDKYVTATRGHFGAEIPTMNEAFFKLPLARTWMFEGSSTSYGPAIRHLRLVFESENPNPIQFFPDMETKTYKLYEVVEGAKIRGRAKPRSTVYISLSLKSNWDRPITWEAAAIADEKGLFHATLPYATTNDNFFVKADGPYRFMSDGRVVAVDVSNPNVYDGHAIEIDMARGEPLTEGMRAMLAERMKTMAPAPAARGAMNIHTMKGGTR